MWRDSDKGLVYFGSSNMTGWDVSLLGGVTYEQWNCLQTTTTGSSTYLVFK